MRGFLFLHTLYILIFDEKMLCQNVPRVGFDAARMRQEVRFVVPD